MPGYVFSTQTIALAVLLAGFRHVTRLPADIRANRLFRLAWVADSSRFLAGVRRGAFVGIVLPAIVLLLPPYLYLLGTRLALMHALSGFLLGAALISLMTFRTSQLPFVASYAPAPDLNTVGPVVLIGGLIAVSIFSRIERFALADIESAAIFWGILAAAAAPAPRRRPQHAARSADRVRRAGTRDDAAGFGVSVGTVLSLQLPIRPGDTTFKTNRLGGVTQCISASHSRCLRGRN